MTSRLTRQVLFFDIDIGVPRDRNCSYSRIIQVSGGEGTIIYVYII